LASRAAADFAIVIDLDCLRDQRPTVADSSELREISWLRFAGSFYSKLPQLLLHDLIDDQQRLSTLIDLISLLSLYTSCSECLFRVLMVVMTLANILTLWLKSVQFYHWQAIAICASDFNPLRSFHSSWIVVSDHRCVSDAMASFSQNFVKLLSIRDVHINEYGSGLARACFDHGH
jgi:hypothetical protein